MKCPLRVQFSSPHVSPAFKHLAWPEEVKSMKKRKGNVTQNMEFPHAITGSEMRDFYRKKTLEEEKIEEEKSMKKVLAAEKAEKKLQDETKKKQEKEARKLEAEESKKQREEDRELAKVLKQMEKEKRCKKKKQDIENKQAEKRANWHEARKCRKKKEISKKKNSFHNEILILLALHVEL